MKLSWLQLTSLVIPATALIAACSAAGSSSSHFQGSGAGPGTGGATTGTGSTGAGGDNLALGSGGAATASSGAGAGGGSGGACNGTLAATVRDFQNAQPDFDDLLGDDKGIVMPDLGADGKPVYAGNPTTSTTHGKADFDVWYRDTPGVNMTFMISLPLTAGANGVSTYDNQAYFPIDNQGFGNESLAHNFSFTTEVHAQFTYKGGEVFTFTGDDDLFVFINKKLVINLGGVHSAETGSVDLGMVAGSIGIVVGQTYPIDLFGAERHPVGSHFRVDTTINCFMSPPPPK
jgi:fibro-slime domain-containing protein